MFLHFKLSTNDKNETFQNIIRVQVSENLVSLKKSVYKKKNEIQCASMRL